MPSSPLHLDEKSSAAPGISPGIVEDDEFLLRALFNPQHIKDGKLLGTAISLQDLRKRGFSVHRLRYVSKEFVRKSVEKCLTRPRNGTPWKNEGIAKLEALEIRQIRKDNKQTLVVIDTATNENPGHASIYTATPEKGDAHARELRNLLLPLLQNRESIDKVFE